MRSRISLNCHCEEAQPTWQSRSTRLDNRETIGDIVAAFPRLPRPLRGLAMPIQANAVVHQHPYTVQLPCTRRSLTAATDAIGLCVFFTTVSANCGPLTEIATSLRSSQSSRFLNTTINENAGTARSAGRYPPDVPHQFREFRSSMLSSGRQTASILIRLVLPDLPFVMPPVITTLSPGCRCIVSRAARSA